MTQIHVAATYCSQKIVCCSHVWDMFVCTQCDFVAVICVPPTRPCYMSPTCEYAILLLPHVAVTCFFVMTPCVRKAPNVILARCAKTDSSWQNKIVITIITWSGLEGTEIYGKLAYLKWNIDILQAKELVCEIRSLLNRGSFLCIVLLQGISFVLLRASL